jgi:hypothetical protein
MIRMLKHCLRAKEALVFYTKDKNYRSNLPGMIHPRDTSLRDKPVSAYPPQPRGGSIQEFILQVNNIVWDEIIQGTKCSGIVPE